MNQKVYKFEVFLILFPISIILIPGLLYMFLVPFGDIIPLIKYGSTQKQMNFIAFQLFNIFSATSLFSIWLISDRYLADKKNILNFSINPFLFISITIGIVISLSAIMEFIYPNHYLKEFFKFNEAQPFLTTYILGLPVCIPALHMLYLSQLK